MLIMSLQLHKTHWQKMHILFCLDHMEKFETKKLEKVIYDLL